MFVGRVGLAGACLNGPVSHVKSILPNYLFEHFDSVVVQGAVLFVAQVAVDADAFSSNRDRVLVLIRRTKSSRAVTTRPVVISAISHPALNGFWVLSV